jgi:hypothetical protein
MELKLMKIISNISFSNIFLAGFLLLSAQLGFADETFDYSKGLSDKPYPFNIPELPTTGNSYKEPVFGTDITRITDIKHGNPLTKAKGVTNEYARMDPINADDSLLVLQSSSSKWFLYDLKTLTFKETILGQGRYEPRWHATDPNILFFTNDRKFYKYHVDSKRKEVLYDAGKDYPTATWLTGKGEGDSSADSRFWAFMVIHYDKTEKKNRTPDWIVFDAEKRQVVSRYSDIPGNQATGANTVTMSMSGQYVLVETNPTQVFNRDWTNGRDLPGRYGHGDLALTKDGRDVFVAQNTKKDHITMVYLDTLEEVKVMYIPFKPPGTEGGVTYKGFHVSGNSLETPGWVLVSTYGRADQPGYWSDGSLFLLELKENGRHFRIAHTNARTSKGGKDYWSEAFATIDRKGQRVIWGSNWGMTGNNYSDAYMVELPENWYRDLEK